MIRICKEESFHQRQGYEILHTLAHGTAGAAGDGPGRGGPLVVPVAGDVRPARRRLDPLRAVDGLEDQAVLQRRAAAALRGHVRAAGRGPRPAPARPGPALERRARALRLHPAGLRRADAGDQGRRAVQPRSGWPTAAGPTTTAPGCARRPRPTPRKQRASRRRDGERHDATGRCGRSSSGPGAGCRTPTSAACTPPTPRWPCATPATSTPAARRASRSGWCRPPRSPRRSPDEKDAFFDPAADKVYRHPTFYEVPDGVAAPVTERRRRRVRRCGSATTRWSPPSGWPSGAPARPSWRRTSRWPTSPSTSSARPGCC